MEVRPPFPVVSAGRDDQADTFVTVAAPPPQAFHSVLWRTPDEDAAANDTRQPACFADLRLDQVVQTALNADSQELAEYFWLPLRDVAAVNWRQAIARDLERPPIRQAVTAFRAGMYRMRELQAQAQKADDRHARARWLLDAAAAAANAIECLYDELAAAQPAADGLRALLAHLDALVGSGRYREWSEQARRLRTDLAALRYTVHIDGGKVTVRAFDDEVDYSTEIADTFARFRSGDVRVERTRLPAQDGRINHVEAAVLDRVALLFPEVFARLQAFCAAHAQPVDPLLLRFDREVAFYLAYLHLIAPLREAGLAVCYPALQAADKSEQAHDTFDLALACKLVAAGNPVVTNDFTLDGAERCIVVSGPNNGGKTTFARTFGQLHYLARLGLPVPGREVRLFLCDAVHTHFEREEHVDTHRGKLQDDLVRMHRILQSTTPASVVVLNEMFSSTTADDALLLARRVMRRLAEQDVLAVYVTFLTELSRFDAHTVSMVSTVDPQDPTVRTFKVVRRAADGRSYAAALAEKYAVTRDDLLRRIAP